MNEDKANECRVYNCINQSLSFRKKITWLAVCKLNKELEVRNTKIKITKITINKYAIMCNHNYHAITCCKQWSMHCSCFHWIMFTHQFPILSGAGVPDASSTSLDTSRNTPPFVRPEPSPRYTASAEVTGSWIALVAVRWISRRKSEQPKDLCVASPEARP